MAAPVVLFASRIFLVSREGWDGEFLCSSSPRAHSQSILSMLRVKWPPFRTARGAPAVDKEITIAELRDYSAIRKLASALHRLDAHLHGAAVMVGAGFSRSAALHVSREKRVPLWDEFTQNLARELYAGETSLNFADPLRVAEEYRAYFGQGALNDKIRFEINDDSWLVGPMYRELLALPWSEVLTTNWDTLLERAAKEIDSPFYTPVTKASDLAWAQSPRIVKLHGTIGVTDAFVAAQEDYRTYPERCAPFVNFARQVFIENELCLLGFSGDDPNFLQWAGWVRDNLASHARRIYLVGALNLSAARRKQLESINIAPIDLYPAVAHINDRDLRHREAISLFLTELRKSGDEQPNPQKWRPTSLLTHGTTSEEHHEAQADAAYGASILSGHIETLREDRLSYPGWVACPPSLSRSLANQISHPFPTRNNLAAMTAQDRAKLLYEIAWRYKTTFEHISAWLSDALFEVANMEQPCGITERQQAEIAVTLLDGSRWLLPDDDEQRAVVSERVNALIAIVERHALYLPDASAEIAYYRALTARDSLDYTELAVLVTKIAGEDTLWMLRRAALSMEVGNPKEALDLIAQAYGILRENHRLDRRSVPVMSRLLWANWLMEAASRGGIDDRSEDLPPFVESNYRKWKCDPWKWLDHLDADIEDRREERSKRENPIVPQFAQGKFQRESVDLESSSKVSDFMLLDGLSRICGIPLRMDGRSFGVNLLANRAASIVRYGGVNEELADLTLAIRSAYSERSTAITETFGRIDVARLSRRTVDILVERCRSAIGYWQKKRRSDIGQESVSRLRVLIEVLARLSVRVSPDEAKDLFKMAATMSQVQEMRFFSLLESIDSLLINSLTSIPPSEQKDVLEAALAFPLPTEVAPEDMPLWPNPVIEHPGERGISAVVDDRITRLIGAVRAGGKAPRRASLHRLLPLVRADFLTETERLSLADSIWSTAPDYATLPDVSPFLPHTLLILPTRDLERAEALLRSKLYSEQSALLEHTQKDLRAIPSPEITSAMEHYEGMASAAADEATHLFPDATQALAVFDRLVAWRPIVDEGLLGKEAQASREALATSLGRALSFAIAPALDESAKTTVKLQQLVDFYAEVQGARSALPALVYFAGVDSRSDKAIEKAIASALRSKDPNRIIYAVIALRRWMEMPDSATSLHFNKLVSMVIGIIDSGREIALQQLLWLTRELVANSRLSDEQCATISDVIPDIFRGADYKRVDRKGEGAVTASTIRTECAKLAQLLTTRSTGDRALEEIITLSREDALPEVRFALHSMSEGSDR